MTRVIFEILVLTNKGSSTSQIIRRANLNSRIAQRHLAFLSNRGLLTNQSEAGAKHYELTVRGKRVLGLLSEYERELGYHRPVISNPSTVKLELPQDARSFGITSGFPSLRRHRRSARWISLLLSSLATLLAGIGVGYMIP